MAGIYVHIPLCKTRCAYCDFYSTTAAEQAGRYVRAVVAEARLRAGELRGEAVRTLYVGGGTPSLLPEQLLRDLVGGLRTALCLDTVEEFTVEVNPDDVTPSLAATLAALGANRVSMGVQSLVDSELRAVGRRHNAAQAVSAVATVREAGIDNVSLDLIYGLPGQTPATWQHSLDGVLALRPDHLSAYALSYEPGTALWRQRESGEVTEATDDDIIAMFEALTRATSEAGYEHYEISNFARLGRRSRHNSAYWTGVPYLGLGAAAHSFDGTVRRHNPADLQRYVASLEAGATVAEAETLEPWERYDEQVMLALRTREGIDTLLIKEKFGDDAMTHLLAAAAPHLRQGCLRTDDRHLTLTAAGLLMCDAIVRDLMWDA